MHRENIETIAAIATAAGEAGISIVRISGPQSLAIADRLFSGTKRPSEMLPNTFAHGFIRVGTAGGSAFDADEVILLVYRAPRSYTAEDVVEIQGHGGRACAGRILGAVLGQGARAAEPGEFTRRAFLNGRIDLIQAEAVADLIGAQSDRAAASALEQLRGRLSRSCNAIYDAALSVAADVEASLDFDEDELPVSTIPHIRDQLALVIRPLESLLATWSEGHLLREGALAVICGQPNAGKSSLMNRLLGRERAIVTEIAGTTRDTLEETLLLDGIPIRLVDTAGLRESDCRIEQEGVRRAQEVMAAADIILLVVDSSQIVTYEYIESIKEQANARTIIVANKQDISAADALSERLPGVTIVRTSMRTGQGLNELKAAMGTLLNLAPHAEPHATVSERHRQLLQSALSEFRNGQERLTEDGGDLLLAAEHLRAGLEDLGLLTGRTYSQELLDAVFSRFCIGK